MELNKAMIDCMRKIRRQLRQESEVEIRLDQPDAVSLMLNACKHSSNQETRQLGDELAQLCRTASPESEPLIEAPEPVHSADGEVHQTVRFYRGQRIA